MILVYQHLRTSNKDEHIQQNSDCKSLDDSPLSR